MEICNIEKSLEDSIFKDTRFMRNEPLIDGEINSFTNKKQEFLKDEFSFQLTIEGSWFAENPEFADFSLNLKGTDVQLKELINFIEEKYKLSDINSEFKKLIQILDYSI